MSTIDGNFSIPNAYGADIDSGQEIEQLKESIQKALTFLAENEGPRLQGPPPKGGRPQLEAPANMKDTDDLALMLLDLRNKVGELQLKTSKEDIQHNMAKKETAHNDRLDQLQKAIDAMKKADKGGMFGKVFGWIAASLSLVAAVAATVATGGAAAPLLAAAALNMTMMVLQETGAMDTITEEFGKLIQDIAGAFGKELSDEEAQMIAGITITAAVLIINIAAAVASGGAASGNLATQTKQIADMIKIGSEIAAGVAMVGQGTSQMVQAGYQNDAMQAQADAADFQKMMAKLQAALSEEMDRLKEIMEQLQDSKSAVIQMMNTTAQQTSKIQRNMV
ncbi:type III secretion system translocon subunit SctE [Acanthopleuribacter pedis]|uniref:Type III secretion system translocon subunit SctE n=1 Tax=Acanthopleuribacter pedis TaxID=442870 RepID=A0A8J7QQ51_9BACT|nr:type III secretion system translocon subunit SctE [Acanthopleuribacter pedis]MBO1322583.1 type III secretion system translocon subunit SctE [Acanthopleuribacter pedis]